MYQKILNFLKYHNLVSIVFTVIFVGFSFSLAASPELREAIYSKEEREIGIDNTLLLATNFDQWDFQPEILSIEEDEENYYVTYKFKTLAPLDNVWQENFKENLLSFPKTILGNRDLPDYITEEIGEVIQHEYQLLKDSQKIAQKEGQSQRMKVTEYSGLIGKVLNLKPKIEPIEPQTSQIAFEATLSQEPTPACAENEGCGGKLPPATTPIDEAIIRQLVEKILAEKEKGTGPISEDSCDSEHLNLCDNKEKCENAQLYWYENACHKEQKPESTTCTPNWQCTDWQPSADSVCSGQTFTQTRTCSDLNNCGAEEGKPEETQQSLGMKNCPSSAPEDTEADTGTDTESLQRSGPL